MFMPEATSCIPTESSFRQTSLLFSFCHFLIARDLSVALSEQSNFFVFEILESLYTYTERRSMCEFSPILRE